MTGSPAPVAIVEIGTNSSKLLIAEVTGPDSFVALKFQKETTRIGEGLSAAGSISAAALMRTINAIGRFLKVVGQYNCPRVAGFATHAFRVAANGPETARRIQDETGLAVRIVTGEEEARYAHISAAAVLDLPRPNTYIVDIGGGSVEFVHATRAGIVETRSLPLGALRLTETYLPSDPVKPDEIRALRRFVSGEIEPLFAAPARSGLVPSQTDLVASGGSITTLKKMSDRSWDFSSVTSPKIRIGSVRRLEATCLALPLDKRRRLSGLDPDRADIIPAGLAVVLAFMEAAGKRVLTVNPHGIRLGVLLSLARNNYRW